MLKSILIGLSSSPANQAAVELGIRWAQRSGALLVGLGIVDERGPLRRESVPLGAAAFKKHRDEILLEQARRETERLLSEFSLRCAEAQVSSKPLEDLGLPWEQIVLEAQRYDLVLLGRHSHFHDEATDDPQTVKDVLLHSPRPIVIVPESLPQVEHVLLAYDGSLPAAQHGPCAAALRNPPAADHRACSELRS